MRRIVLAVALLAPAAALPAQLPIPRPAIVGGISTYRFAGDPEDQRTAIGALRVELPAVLFLAEGSLAVFRPRIGGNHYTYVIPEAQAQWQILPAIVRPYLGVGAGWLKPLSGPNASVVTYSASAGVRAGLPILPIGLRAEARIRTGGSGFKRLATELTAGVSW